jgi:hypothetical protein
MKDRIRIRRPKQSANAREKRAETHVEKVNHPLLSSSEMRSIGLPNAIVWGAAQMDPWALGNDGAVKTAFKKIADVIWHQGADQVDDLVIQTVCYSLIFFIYSDWPFSARATPF